MAKNTGRGSRVASPDYIRPADQPQNMWTRQPSANRSFEDAKRVGGLFRGVVARG